MRERGVLFQHISELMTFCTKTQARTLCMRSSEKLRNSQLAQVLVYNLKMEDNRASEDSFPRYLGAGTSLVKNMKIQCDCFVYYGTIIQWQGHFLHSFNPTLLQCQCENSSLGCTRISSISAGYTSSFQ